MKKSDTPATGFASICVRDEPPQFEVPPHMSPIYTTSSFAFASAEQGMDIFSGKKTGHVYGRYGNPGMEQVARKIADLETFETTVKAYGLMCSSGMAAISTLLLTLCKPGDVILTQGNLYGGTTELFNHVFKKLEITPLAINLSNTAFVEETLKNHEHIRVLFMETPSNPTLECLDLERLIGLAGENGVRTIIDNTFCTPYLQQPFRFGADAIIHSTTKYLNGHGNSIAGAIVIDEEKIDKDEVWQSMQLVGTNANPFDAWLTGNGIKTLPLRMDKHSGNALEIAKRLATQEVVTRVNYPGLETHPSHQLAIKQMKDFGGMLSFELNGGLEAGIRFMNHISFCTLAPTLGDVDTLILHPASMSHRNVDPEVRLANGITDGLIRLSVGIEDVEDIWTDLERALESVNNT